MSPLEIIKLVGFATGAALHFYITWLIWARRLAGQNTTQPERLINILNLCLGVWFLGNLLISLQELLLGRYRVTPLLRVWNVFAMTGVALLPAALLHAHLGVWASIDNYKRWSRVQVARFAWLFYLPMIFLPYAIYRIVSGDYRSFLLKLRVLLVPYSIWYGLMMCCSAYIDLRIRDRLDARATRERMFFNRLAVLLVLNGIFEFVIVAILGAGPDQPGWIAFVLSSLFPIFFVVYHVYRYKFVDVAVKESLAYAVFALLFIAVYTYGVRRFDQFLVDRFEIRPGVVEVMLILGMVALASPLVRAIDRAVHRLFTREIGLYRDVVRQVSSGAVGFGELTSLIRYTEDVIRRGLDVREVRITPYDVRQSNGQVQRLADKLREWQADVIENDEALAPFGASIAYALKREGKLIGLMIVSAEPHSLTSEKRAVLDVLAGQVATEVESCCLIEEKIRLERELASRERLATLGQMAAQVAHEVKNPLSSIKSIVQVMREENAGSEYERDLKLIVNEVDRLNTTVSQLLAFSRPSRAESRRVSLDELLESTVAFAAAESAERGVSIAVSPDGELQLSGTQAGALREALSNLVLNAVQACDRGGSVEMRATATKSSLSVEVSDNGPGIPPDAQPRVFEPFYSTKSRGTGLGLAIVQRRIVELGGAVKLESPVAEGHGTRFTVTVPVDEAMRDRMS